MKIENIKFKAKELGTGKWKVGFLQRDMDYNLCILIANKEDHSWYWTQIDPSTVCQFTGLTDCENQDIYEGDILAEKECPEFEVGYINCTFAAAYVGDDKFIFNLTALSEVCTVCGNKFDRKEGEK